MVSRTFPDFASSTKLMICATVNTRARAHQEEGRRQPGRRALESKRERESESKAASCVAAAYIGVDVRELRLQRRRGPGAGLM
jgi:hypothetical protein